MQPRPVIPLDGLAAAAPTPFTPEGALHLAIIPSQAQHLLQQGLRVVVVGGLAGESHALALEERRELVRQWFEVVRGTELKVIVQVGGACVAEAKILAAEADQLGAQAIASLPPAGGRPEEVRELVEDCAPIAAAAPDTPFYYWHHPAHTGVNLSMVAFLAEAPGRIPTLGGVVFQDTDLRAYQECLQAGPGRFDIPYGLAESVLGAFALGGRGAIAEAFGLAGPLYRALLGSLQRGELEKARQQQFRAAQLAQLLQRFGAQAASKAALRLLGVDVGPVRRPARGLSAAEFARLREALVACGFFQQDAQPLRI